MQEEAPLDEVREQLVDGIGAHRPLERAASLGRCDGTVEGLAAGGVGPEPWSLDRTDDVDPEPLAESPDADANFTQETELDAVASRARALDRSKLPARLRTILRAMAATIMDGRALAERIRGQVKAEVEELGGVGLATVLVGEDPASDVYIRAKHKASQEVGIEARDVRLPVSAAEADVLDAVAQLNADDGVDGLLVQLPLPDGMDESRVIRAVDPVKDVDGFHPLNAGQLYLGEPGHVGGTPLGIVALLEEYDVRLEGAEAVVLGRSDIVGKPVTHLLLQRHATVTICHSRTRDLAAETARADVLVAAVGVPGIVRPEMVKEGACVIDVGITRTDEGLLGDVAPETAERAGLITPVPGGVGPMTVALLLRNAVRAARFRRGELAFPGM
jgi:methylenetetrahydrofolate dehydrogenase (NADP+)/methenyltetrahydrofolate cyclohydrolase